MRVRSVFLLFAFAPATAAFAAEVRCNTPEETPPGIECKPQPQQSLNQCYRDAFDNSEKALDEAYYTVMDRFQGQRDTLELAKETWKVHRDAECLFSSSEYETGSEYPTILYECKARYNRAQECRLKNHFMNCKGGEPLCPVPLAR